MGLVGGMIPCPSAIFIILLSYNLQVLGLGIALAVVFSLGMAIVLVVLGILAVKGYGVAERYGRKKVEAFFRIVPVLSGAFIAAIGVGLFLNTLGWLKIPGLTQ